MPISEFRDHWHFWINEPWGVSDDLLACILDQSLSQRTNKRPQNKLWTWKVFAAQHAKKQQIRKIDPAEMNKNIRKGFDHMFNVFGTDNNGRKSEQHRSVDDGGRGVRDEGDGERIEPDS